MGGFELKPIAKDAIPRAIEKAERYRLLNEPFLAESICLDVLAVDPDHQQALTIYILALTDQFGARGQQGSVQRARSAIARLEGEYERLYYSGLVCERRGHALAASDALGSREGAWGWLVEAMHHYERAMQKRPAGNDDAILRWNTCVRLIESFGLTAPSGEREEYPLE